MVYVPQQDPPLHLSGPLPQRTRTRAQIHTAASYRQVTDQKSGSKDCNFTTSTSSSRSCQMQSNSTSTSTQTSSPSDIQVLASNNHSPLNTADPEALPYGSCLLYVPLTVQGLPVRALLDSGASDNFISERLVNHLSLPRHPLHTPLQVQLANGSSVVISNHVRTYINLGGLKIRLLMKVVPTPFPLIFGYAFLSYFKPNINWKTRVITLTYNSKPYVI